MLYFSTFPPDPLESACDVMGSVWNLEHAVLFKYGVADLPRGIL